MNHVMTQVPAVATLVAFGLPLAAIVLAGFIVYISLRHRQRRTEQLLETVKHLADRGMPVPPSLLQFGEGNNGRPSRLFSAITLLGVGVGLALMFYFMNLRPLIGVGLMLLCIGTAQLIAIRIESRRPGHVTDATPPPAAT